MARPRWRTLLLLPPPSSSFSSLSSVITTTFRGLVFFLILVVGAVQGDDFDNDLRQALSNLNIRGAAIAYYDRVCDGWWF